MFNTKWTIYIVSSKIIKTSDPRSLVLNLANKIDLKKNDKIFVSTIHGKILKDYVKRMNLKYQLQHGFNSNYLMDHILYQVFKIILRVL